MRILRTLGYPLLLVLRIIVAGARVLRIAGIR